jgi:hypothetical protein
MMPLLRPKLWKNPGCTKASGFGSSAFSCCSVLTLASLARGLFFAASSSPVRARTWIHGWETPIQGITAGLPRTGAADAGTHHCHNGVTSH